MTDYSKEAVGRRLKSGLVDKGLSNEEFAEKKMCLAPTAEGWEDDPVALTRWYDGRTGMSFENAIAVADGLDWPLDKLACRGEFEAG